MLVLLKSVTVLVNYNNLQLEQNNKPSAYLHIAQVMMSGNIYRVSAD